MMWCWWHAGGIQPLLGSLFQILAVCLACLTRVHHLEFISGILLYHLESGDSILQAAFFDRHSRVFGFFRAEVFSILYKCNLCNLNKFLQEMLSI